MHRIGTGLLKESKGNKSSHRKDILSVLAQANTVDAKAHQMKDEDVMSRAYKFIFGLVLFTHILSEIPTFIIAGHETTRYTCPQTFCNENHEFWIFGVVSQWHGRYMLYLKINMLRRNFVKRYPIYLLIIQQWKILMDYLIWMLSYAKLCVYIRCLVVFNERQGRMIASLLVSHLRIGRELSVMKFGTLLIHLSQLYPDFCVNHDDIESGRVNL